MCSTDSGDGPPSLSQRSPAAVPASLSPPPPPPMVAPVAAPLPPPKELFSQSAVKAATVSGLLVLATSTQQGHGEQALEPRSEHDLPSG